MGSCTPQGQLRVCFGREAAWTGGMSRAPPRGFTGERHPELVVPGPRCGRSEVQPARRVDVYAGMAEVAFGFPGGTEGPLSSWSTAFAPTPPKRADGEVDGIAL